MSRKKDARLICQINYHVSVLFTLFSGSRLDQATSGSQQSQFQDFLLRANKYNTLDIFGDTVSSKKIIFVEVSDLLQI